MPASSGEGHGSLKTLHQPHMQPGSAIPPEIDVRIFSADQCRPSASAALQPKAAAVPQGVRVRAT